MTVATLNEHPSTHQGPRRDQEGGGLLDPHVSPEEIMSREVELGCESWASFASPQQQCNGHCPCDSAQARQLKQQFARCTSRCAMARGHRLNTSIVLAAVHGLSGLFRGGIRGRAFTLSSPPHAHNPSLISHIASVDVKQYGQHPSKINLLCLCLNSCFNMFSSSSFPLLRYSPPPPPPTHTHTQYTDTHTTHTPYTHSLHACARFLFTKSCQTDKTIGSDRDWEGGRERQWDSKREEFKLAPNL